jgi:ribosomal protein L12E/L44/L45/RPP1/RPP2
MKRILMAIMAVAVAVAFSAPAFAEEKKKEEKKDGSRRQEEKERREKKDDKGK